MMKRLLGVNQEEKNQGRKSDGGFKFVHEDSEQQLFHTEIKTLRVINELTGFLNFCRNY